MTGKRRVKPLLRISFTQTFRHTYTQLPHETPVQNGRTLADTVAHTSAHANHDGCVLIFHRSGVPRAVMRCMCALHVCSACHHACVV